MKIIIPMAGQGQRFVDAGYTDPKPFIKVNGKMIIEYIVDMFDKENDEFYFIISKKHLSPSYREILLQLVKKYTLFVAPENNLGPVYSMLNAEYVKFIDDLESEFPDPPSGGLMDFISNDEPVIVSYCDNPFLFDYDTFLQYSMKNTAGVIFSHVGFHPHRLASTYMAYLKTDPATGASSPLVTAVQEKKPYTNYHWSEHASTGTYYFQKGYYIKKYFKELIDKKLCHTNGEFYVTLVYNLMISDGLEIRAWDSSYVTVFGTPEEVKNFEAWQTILQGAQVKEEGQVLSCYHYWKEYNFRKDRLKKLILK